VALERELAVHAEENPYGVNVDAQTMAAYRPAQKQAAAKKYIRCAKKAMGEL
tara:strand:+ start:277 stop:432 length:156 start_codon:yes stop_codon:yes gene_type:complete